MENFELDINNYAYDELLGLFNMDAYSSCNKDQMDKKINKIKSSYPTLTSFYKKAQKIIVTIDKYLENKKDTDTFLNIEDILYEIKKTPDFEQYSENSLLDKIIDKTMREYNKNINDYSYLNEPNLNVSKFDPSLNNKNNTNTINNTFPNAVAPGHLNPVKRITQNQNLNLNSCFRHNYYQSNPCDFLYLLPVEIKNVLSIRIVSLELPNAWYLFSHIQKNNTFTIEVKVDKVKHIYKIVIPDGNYDVDSLQCFLNSTYFYESNSNLDSYLKYIKFSIDPYNLKTRFDILDNEFDIFTFSLVFVSNISQNIMNTCGWILGFRLANYFDITEKIQSEGLFDGGGDRYIYVALNDYQYNNNSLNTVCFDKSILNEDVIAKIPMINGKLSLVVSDDNNPLAKIRRYTGPVNISKLHIKILDKFGAIIDLNNMDYSITFEMEILYESFNFKNVTV